MATAQAMHAREDVRPGDRYRENVAVARIDLMRAAYAEVGCAEYCFFRRPHDPGEAVTGGLLVQRSGTGYRYCRALGVSTEEGERRNEDGVDASLFSGGTGIERSW